ncbi:MAG: FKBP-type peptidyl-prolyl cis-trans isomerase [Thermoanaerobaculia bacterium]
MRSIFAVCLSLSLGVAGFAAAQAEKPESVEDRASYGLGLNMGRQMTAQGVRINVDLLARGLRDGLAGSESLLTDQEIQTAMQTLQQQVQQAMQAKMAAEAEANQKAGDAFLAGNAVKEGVVTLESGLQYKVVTNGAGSLPVSSDTVRVHYEGRLIDGTVFDSSYQRGQPAEFQVTGVIQGWIEALQLMKVGSKWELYIPSALAYGQRGQGPKIGPNAVLVFDVELLEIVSPESES